ncbi:MAG TPA: choice-of-anchor D domain-containing protein, partial [Candidatus Dormibacteraeota bacterium]|nr:choice-of-anchor D domain-containing protein [Candidatus Dormibacteraeota bacterium]
MRLRPGLALAVLALGLPIGPAARSVDATAPAPVVDSVRACPPAPAKHVACQSRVLRVGGAIVHPEVAHGRVLAAAGASFTGLTPSQVRAAYGITGDGAGQTVAVVGAFDNPSITGSGSDNLATYRTMYGLPPCTTGNGCFRKVDENGGTGYTAGDNGWNLEMDLDTQAVSAIAPGAHILLVETAAEDLADVVTAVGTAARLGATEISLSLGGAEFTGETGNDSAFLHQGVFVSAASGDAGFGAQYPAAASTVSSIGGTTLAQDSSARGWSETVWSGTGGGCSAFEAKPSWQRDPLCTKRTTNDVAADGDPQSGLAVYDAGSWIVVGGTSLSTPLIAGMVAVGGGGGDAVGAQGFYAEPSSSFNDVTSGSNGCGGAICRASAGFDSPTGFGSPAGAPAPLAYPTAAVSPPSLAFGGQTLGTTSASKGVVLSASNGGDLHVSTAAVSGPFAITSNGCSGAVLSGSQTCSVSVDFTPGGVGPQSGSLVISSDAGNGAQTVTLGGTGVGVPGASVPSSASAGTVTLGQGSSVGVTVTSTGSGPLVMGTSQISGSGAFLLGGSTCTSGTSVAPGTACTITVVFSPAAAGPASATLTIHDSAASSPQSVALTGTAVAAPPPQPPPVPGSPPPPPPVATGYWLTGADGSVYPFGA